MAPGSPQTRPELFITKANSRRPTPVGLQRGGTIVIWSYNHQTKETATFTLHEDFQADTHDNPAFYVRKDGCIQVFYTKHNTEKLVRSFVSTHPEDISQWEPVDHIQTRAKSTYTLVFRLSAENDRVYLFTRALNYHPSALRSEDDGKTWSEPVQLINVGRGRPYQRMVSDGISKIHVAFTTGHPRNEKNNSVYYFYYENGACYKADGTFIKKWKDLPVVHTEADLVYDGSTHGRAWTWDLAIGTDGNPRCGSRSLSTRDRPSILLCEVEWCQVVKQRDDQGGKVVS